MYFFLLLFFVSFGISLLLIVVLKKLFTKWNLLDNPKKYHKKRSPVPYSMGIVFFLSFFLISYFFVDHSVKLMLLWVFGGVITLMSFVDDRINLSAKFRLIIQIIIASIIGLSVIKIGYVSSIFGGWIDFESYKIDIFGYSVYFVSLLFTIIWYVFIFNALNWSDGIPGNTSGISFISFFVIGCLGYKLYITDTYEGGVENALFIIKISLILCGVLLPFFFFDVKERILMGDTGTMFLGFMLASLAIISGGKIATVLVVFGVYAIDAMYVIFMRLKDKKNPLKGDFTHLHHRLLDIGLSKIQVLFFIFSSSFIFGITSLFLDKVGKILLFLCMIVFVIYFPKLILYLKGDEKK